MRSQKPKSLPEYTSFNLHRRLIHEGMGLQGRQDSTDSQAEETTFKISPMVLYKLG